MLTTRSRLFFIILFNYLCFSQSINSTYEESIVIQFNKVALKALDELGYGPLTGRRISAILLTCIFNAWASFDSKAIGLEIKTFSRQPESERTFKNKHKAISYAAYYTLKTLLPSKQALFDKVMINNGYDIQTLSDDRTTSAGLAISLAKELLSIRENDGSNQLGNLNPSHSPYSEPILLSGYKPYESVNTVDTLNDINKWQPQRNPDGSSQQYTFPHWGYVTPFVLTSVTELMPIEGPITTKDFPAFLAQAERSYNISKTLTQEQKLIAEYWSAALWDPMAEHVSKRDRYDLDDDVKIFFILSCALSDAFIITSYIQRYYNSVRPITVIHKFIDPEWKPFLTVPPQPDFISAHSAASGAASEFFKIFTGSDQYGGSFTDAKTGITLNWPTFSDAAEQARMSRVYAGVHSERSTLVGKEVGQKVAQAIWKKIQYYLNGNVKKPSHLRNNALLEHTFFNDCVHKN